jgi:uncharacterized glyoxalase superfamily protein PhnB
MTQDTPRDDVYEVLPGQVLPRGYGSVNPFVAVRGPGGAPAFIRFVGDVFGARETSRRTRSTLTTCSSTPRSGSATRHLMLCDAKPHWSSTPALFEVYVSDVDAVVDRAKTSGAEGCHRFDRIRPPAAPGATEVIAAHPTRDHRCSRRATALLDPAAPAGSFVPDAKCSIRHTRWSLRTTRGGSRSIRARAGRSFPDWCGNGCDHVHFSSVKARPGHVGQLESADVPPMYGEAQGHGAGETTWGQSRKRR